MMGKCVYCDQPITWDDWKSFNVYFVKFIAVAHKECRVEPKVRD